MQDKLSLFEIINSFQSAVYYQYLLAKTSSVSANSTAVAPESHYWNDLNTILDLLSAYSDLAGQNMVPGNYPLDSVTTSCRVRTITASTSLSLTLSAPQTALEEYYKANLSTISVLSQSIGNHSVRPITIISCRAKYLSVIDKQINSDPIFLYTSLSDSDSLTSKEFQTNLTMLDSLPVRNLEDKKEEIFYIHCYAGFYRVVNYTCLDGTVIGAICNSSTTGLLRGQCPLVTYHSYCSYLLLNESFESTNYRSCNSYFDEQDGIVSCSCPLLFENSTLELIATTEYNLSVDSFRSIAYSAKIAKSVLPFQSTFIPSGRDQDPKLVYSTVGSVLLSIFLILCINIRVWNKRHVVPAKASKLNSSKVDEKSSFQLKQLIEKRLPLVFRNISFKSKIIYELRRYHTVLKVVVPLPVSVRMTVAYIVSLFSEWMIVMCVLAGFLSLLNHDSGKCLQAHSSQDCFQISSSTGSICNWEVDTISHVELCVFSSAGRYASVRIVLAMLSMVIGSVASLLLNLILYRCCFSSSSSIDNRLSDEGFDVIASPVSAASLDDEAAMALCK